MKRQLQAFVWCFLLTPIYLIIVLVIGVADGLWALRRAVGMVKEPSGPEGPVSNEASSIVILNWDGKHHLEENLPSVVQAVEADGGDHEIIVVDNGSKDGSLEFVRDRYPEIKVVALPENQLFARGNNAGAAESRYDVVIFLNNDMSVDEDFIRPLLEPFSQTDVFAVASQVFFKDASARREETGKTSLSFHRGSFVPSHEPVTEGDESAGTVAVAWAGGGACAVDKHKFFALGGFDTLFEPFYWEDTSLSYTAWKRGWRCLLAVKSRVHHHHRGTSRPRFGEEFIEFNIRKNAYLFTWRNLTDPAFLARHLLCLPLSVYRYMIKGSPGWEARAFLRAFRQLPAALSRRYRSWAGYRKKDVEALSCMARKLVVPESDRIDFNESACEGNLGAGWYEHEVHQDGGFRWTASEASFYLRAPGPVSRLSLEGWIPDGDELPDKPVKVRIRTNSSRGEVLARPGQTVRLDVPLALKPDERLIEARIQVSRTFVPASVGMGPDVRRLGLLVRQIAVH